MRATTHRLRNLALLTTALLLGAATLVVAQPDVLDSTPATTAAAPNSAAASEHETYTLQVLVTQPSRTGPHPAAGATVIVYEVDRHRDRLHAEPAARAQTDADGTATFQLPQAAYGLRAAKGDLGAHQLFKLGDDKRVHLHLNHGRDRQPGPYNLGLAAYDRELNESGPAANASVLVERYVRNSTGWRNGTWEPVERGKTDARGHDTTTLPAGLYRVTVTDADGEQAIKRVPLKHDRWVRLLLQEPGSTDERPTRDHARLTDRTEDRPADARIVDGADRARLAHAVKAHLRAALDG